MLNRLNYIISPFIDNVKIILIVEQLKDKK